MRKRIDCHVHIRPEWLLGFESERFGMRFSTYGAVLGQNGEIENWYTPEYIQDTKFTAESILQVMSRYGVEKAVVLQNIINPMNWDIVSAVNRYPDKFAGAMVIEPEPADTVLNDIKKFHSIGLSSIKYEMGTFPKIYPDFKFDASEMYKVWELAEELQITITVDTHPVGSPGYQVEAFKKMIRDFPNLKLVICHAGFPDDCIWENKERYKRWCEMVELAGNENVYLDMSALVDLFASDSFPFPNVMKLISDIKKRVGGYKLMWGTDIPGTYANATYRQMIEMFEKTDILTEEEKDCLFYENAQKLYFDNRSGI